MGQILALLTRTDLTIGEKSGSQEAEEVDHQISPAKPRASKMALVAKAAKAREELQVALAL